MATKIETIARYRSRSARENKFRTSPYQVSLTTPICLDETLPVPLTFVLLQPDRVTNPPKQTPPYPVLPDKSPRPRQIHVLQLRMENIVQFLVRHPHPRVNIDLRSLRRVPEVHVHADNETLRRSAVCAASEFERKRRKKVARAGGCVGEGFGNVNAARCKPGCVEYGDAIPATGDFDRLVTS